MFFKKRSPNSRKKIFYTLKVTEQEYLTLRSFLKENKIPYKKRFKLKFNLTLNTSIALSLAIILMVLIIIFMKVVIQ